VTHVIVNLPVLVIHAHSRCNCRCTMCDIWKNPEQTEFSLSDLQARMRDIQQLGVEWVVFTGGEPLMHSDLFALSRELRRRNIHVTILSTGLLLERYASQVAQDLDEVIVSLDGPAEIHDRIRRVPGAFRAIQKGVQAIRAIRPGFRITARSTVQKMNHAALTATVEAARALALDSISFLAADLAPDNFGRAGDLPPVRQDELSLTLDELQVLESEMESLISRRDPLAADTQEHLRRIVRHFRALLGMEEFSAPRCNAPWVSAVIETDGRIRPCFFHLPYATPDLNASEAVRFRESLNVAENSICRRCVCSLYRPQMT
jgi:MoaA/NifB/PqqE/SkfB family radical SAM enzyme